MSLFKFLIYDIHEIQKHNEYGELYTEPISNEWQKFHMIINVNYIEITSFRSYILFDTELNPTPCTKVYLSDGSFIYAVNRLETFALNYLNDYLPLFKPKVSDTL